MAKTKKEPVTLRQKVLADGSKSLYLDIYWNRKRSYEFLKLYLINAKTPLEKQVNKETLATAQAIKAKRQIELQNNEYGFASHFKLDTPFLDYFRKMCKDREDSKGNSGNWESTLKHLERYCSEKTTFKDVTSNFVEGFKDHLNNAKKDTHKVKYDMDKHESKPLSKNTKSSYFNKLRACINQAFEEKILPINPLRGIEGFGPDDTERVYLTLEEVKSLIATDCRYPILKRAFLFCCLTGIRKSDMEKMVWGEIKKFGDFTRVTFKQKKTKGQEYLDINKQAEIYLGDRKKDDEKVFSGYSTPI